MAKLSKGKIIKTGKVFAILDKNREINGERRAERGGKTCHKEGRRTEATAHETATEGRQKRAITDDK
jgi:hypothetical protein